MLYSTTFKKIRNNIMKSNQSCKPRCLTLYGKQVTWKQFREAFDWDQANFSLPLHEKLTLQHFEVDSAGKMRNHLAEDVLDRKMLYLMQVCRLFIHTIMTFYYGSTVLTISRSF